MFKLLRGCKGCNDAFLSQVDMYAGALFIQLALQWNIYLAVLLLLSITAFYTVAGDLSHHLYGFRPITL